MNAAVLLYSVDFLLPLTEWNLKLLLETEIAYNK